MLEEEKTVGPKGQVVIPGAIRKVLKIQPGSKVVFRLEDDRATVQKQEFDAVRTLEGVAHRGRSIRRIRHTNTKQSWLKERSYLNTREVVDSSNQPPLLQKTSISSWSFP